jgi:RNA polymerase sigma-70 factor, ECF subfamily
LLELYRRYLTLLARVQIGQRLQGKVDAADLVQETFLDAHRNFLQFRGVTEGQLANWLRQILAAKLADLMRRYLGAKGRDVHLEREIGEAVDRSSVLLDRGLVAPGSSPSQQASHREQSVLLADALEQLPDDYREVLVLRHLEGLTFPEVAGRMGRSLDSVEKLWMRGLARLRQIMGDAS